MHFRKWSGVCICKALEHAPAGGNFPWNAISTGFRSRDMFECSCGAHWWLDSGANAWITIKEPSEWKKLAERDGLIEYEVTHLKIENGKTVFYTRGEPTRD